MHVIVYSVVDDALSPDFPLPMRRSSAARMPSASLRRFAATILTSRPSWGSSCGSSRRAGWT